MAYSTGTCQHKRSPGSGLWFLFSLSVSSHFEGIFYKLWYVFHPGSVWSYVRTYLPLYDIVIHRYSSKDEYSTRNDRGISRNVTTESRVETRQKNSNIFSFFVNCELDYSNPVWYRGCGVQIRVVMSRDRPFVDRKRDLKNPRFNFASIWLDNNFKKRLCPSIDARWWFWRLLLPNKVCDITRGHSTDMVLVLHSRHSDEWEKTPLGNGNFFGTVLE